MRDETEARSVGALGGPGHSGGGAGEQSPLQARVQFLKNRSWDLVTGLNRGACARGGAQHGQNSESYAAVAADWEIRRQQVLSLTKRNDRVHATGHFRFPRGMADVRL